jgi:hypothetical protein
MAQSLKRLAGLEGVYARGAIESEPIIGVPTQHEYEVEDNETGLPTRVISYDWRFTASELVLGGNVITPRSGDRWKPTIGDVEETYEVLPIGKRPCFERLDTSGVLLLVHTKKVG